MTAEAAGRTLPMPLPGWLRSYPRAWLRRDLVSGLTAAAVVIPNAMAYAVIAGLTVEVGLYTALAAMLAYPLLGTSRPLSVSTTSAIAMLTATQVALAASGGVQASPAAIAATLALLVGGILVLARLLRLGFLANFISFPVLVGFKAGVGLVIIIGQLKSVLGIQIASRTALGTVAELPGRLAQTHWPTLLVALAGIGLLLGLRRRFPKFPAPLAVVVLSIAAAAGFGLASFGIKPVGTMPSGLPALALPDLATAALLWPGALGIALMSFAESVAAARAFAQRQDRPVDANRELLALGAANLAAAFAGGMPAGGGASQTAITDASGARSQMAQWAGAAAVLVSLLLLAPVISLLPKAALGALIMVTAASMVRIDHFLEIAGIRKDELAWALVALAGVVLVGTLPGILIGVVISLLTLLYQANHPVVYALAYNRDKNIFRSAGSHAQDETIPGLLMLRTEGLLTFANAERTAEKMRALMVQHGPRVIVLECSGIADMEYTALLMLTEAERNLRVHGLELWLAAINPDLLKIIERSPLAGQLGRGRMFYDLHLALQAYLARGEGPPRPARTNLA
jgi:high affinity sulfate transporter 1